MRDRCKVGNRIVAERAVETAIHRQRGCRIERRVAVGIGACNHLGPDVGPGAAPVLDHDLLVPNLRQLLGNDAGDHVGRSAGSERHDEADDAVGPDFSPGRTADDDRREGGRRRHPDRVAAGDHGPFPFLHAASASHSRMLIPASLMTGPHLSISDLMWRASSSGVEPTRAAPSGSSRSFTGGWASAATMSACILAMIGAGVLAGKKKANHDETSKPGTPASAMVGRSGPAGTRFLVVTANPRALPARTCGSAGVTLSKIRSRRPAITSCSAGADPRYGTCVISIPVMRLNNSPDRCTDVPMPPEP